MKKLKAPEERENQPLVPIIQERFDAEYRDIPASELPENAIAKSLNVLLFGEYWMVRPGTALWSAANLPSVAEEMAFSAGGTPLSPLPSLPGRADYAASKSGDIITKTQGDSFTDDDLYRYFEWPEGVRDIIIEIINSNQVKVKSDEARTDATEETPARIVGRIFSWIWHDSSRLIFIHIDSRVFYTDWQMRSYTEVMNVSGVDLSCEKSTMDDYKGFVDVFTSSGIFRIDPKADIIQMYRMNTAVELNPMTGNDRNTQINVGRRYIYAPCRLDGTGFRNRGTARIMKEMAPNLTKKTGDEYRDFKELYWASEPNSGQDEVAGAGCGGEGSYLQSLNDITNDLDTFTAVTDGSFQLDVNTPDYTGTYNIVNINLSAAESWDDIAVIIQKSMRDQVPELAESFCKYLENRFYIFIGIRDYYLARDMATIAGVGTDLTPAGYLDMQVDADVYYSTAHVVKDLMVNNDKDQWTHYSVYGTKSLEVKQNESFEQACARMGYNPFQYIWLDDIPVAKAFTASMDIWGLLTATKGTFEKFDVGSTIIFQNGRSFGIQEYVSDTQVYVDGYSRWYGVDAFSAVYSQSAAIGCNRILTASQDGTRVTRTGGKAFRTQDKHYFWSDGSDSYLKEWISEDEIEVWDSATRESQGCCTELIKRNFNDTITNEPIHQEKAVEPRSAYPILINQRRSFIEMPSGNLGCTTAGMMFVTSRNSEEVFYSNAPVDQEGLFGHYNPYNQRVPVKDSVQSLWEFPDKVVVFCSNQTFKILTNTFNEIINSKTNEYIAVVTGISVISSNIGIKNQASIRPIENGQCVVVTYENGSIAARIFDGYGYGENLCMDSEGKAYIWEDLKALQSVVTTGYNELYGFMLWGTDETTINGKVLEMTKCYHYGFQPGQAQGWGEFGGPGWVYPEPEIGVLTIFSNIEQPFLIVWDAETGLPYRLATRAGSQDSGITRVWKDKVGIGYEAGYEIPWYLYLREHSSPQENQLLRFLTAFFAFRPQDEANKGLEGYTETGYRTAQQITIHGLQNGNITETVQTKDIPDRADVVFTKLLQDNRLQYKISGTASEIKGVKHNIQYELKDQRGAPSRRYMSEADWQEEMAEPDLWICRNVVTNLADNSEPTGSVFGFAKGPDEEDSKIIFSSTSSLLYASTNTYPGDFSFMAGVTGVTGTTELMRIGSAIISIRLSGGQYYLKFNDGTETYEQALEDWAGNDWTLLKLSRYEDALIFSQDGLQLTSMIIDEVRTLSGDYDFQSGNAKSLFDVRLFPKYISEDCFEYYFRDVVQYKGIGTLCPS